MNTWLSRCLEGSHPFCPPIHESLLPSRVIEVLSKDSRHVQLYLSASGEHGRYAALSYCWGIQQHYVTELDTLQHRINGIPTSSLPKTIQDAIHITRQLSIQYLWVDSLCIIQDSDDDKSQEISRMPQIYKNAVVTISADRASDCQDGFLNQAVHKDRIPGVTSAKIPYRSANGTVGHLRLRQAIPYSRVDQPIHQRAWTFQEYFLSSRILSFGHQLLLRCPSGEDMEFGLLLTNTFLPGPHLMPAAKGERNPFSDKLMKSRDRILALVQNLDYPKFFTVIGEYHQPRSVLASQAKAMASAVNILGEDESIDLGGSFWSSTESESETLLVVEEMGHKDLDEETEAMQQARRDFIELEEAFKDLGMPDYLKELEKSPFSLEERLTLMIREYTALFKVSGFDQLRNKWAEDLWIKIVEHFSARHISDPRDRLLAISGIASLFADFIKGRYLAGLWEGNILKHLAWRLDQKNPLETKDRTEHAHSCFPDSHTIPTWSWASIPGRITHGDIRNSCVEVIECSVELAYEALVFGQVKGAFLKLRAPLKRVDHNWFSGGVYKPLKIYPDPGRALFSVTTSIPDPLDYDNVHYFWLMALAHYRDKWHYQTNQHHQMEPQILCGLVLLEVEPDVFERVGYYQSAELGVTFNLFEVADEADIIKEHYERAEERDESAKEWHGAVLTKIRRWFGVEEESFRMREFKLV